MRQKPESHRQQYDGARTDPGEGLVEAVGGFSIEFPIIESQDQPPVAR